VSQTDSRDCFVGSSQVNPERRVPMVQQCNQSAEHRCRSVFPSAAEKAAVVETPSLRCAQGIRDTEMGASLRLNLC